MRLFIICFLLPGLAEGSRAPVSKKTLSLRQTRLGQTVLEGNIHGFRIELSKLLDEPMGELLKAVNAETLPVRISFK